MLRTLPMFFCILLVSQQLFAEEVVCPAVWPCDQNGVIDPIFDTKGPCGDHFRSLCLEARADVCEHNLEEAHTTMTTLESQLVSLSAEVRRQKKRIRRLRRRRNRN